MYIKTGNMIKQLQILQILYAIDPDSVSLQLQSLELRVLTKIFYFGDKVVRKIKGMELLKTLKVLNFLDDILLEIETS